MKKVSLPIDHRLVPHEPGKLPPPPEPPFFPPPISYPPPPPPPCYPPMVTKVQNAVDVVAGEGIEVVQGFNHGMTAFEVSAKEMVGATKDSDGESGVVPVPPQLTEETEARFLRADGTWCKVEVPESHTFTELTDYESL